MKTPKDGRVDKMYSMSVLPGYLKLMFLWAQMPWVKISVGTNVDWHKCRWAQMSMGTSVGRHKCRWVGTNVEKAHSSAGTSVAGTNVASPPIPSTVQFARLLNT